MSTNLGDSNTAKNQRVLSTIKDKTRTLHLEKVIRYGTGKRYKTGVMWCRLVDSDLGLAEQDKSTTSLEPIEGQAVK